MGKPTRKYINDKIKALKDFGIRKNWTAYKKYLCTLSNEIEVDRECRTLILKKLS